MKNVVIERGYTPLGVVGSLSLAGFECVTLERPDLNNKKNISCIPEGHYVCSLVNSPSFGRVYKVKNVTNRTSILIHPLNLVKQSEGCIGLGRRFTIHKNQLFITSSELTVNHFMRLLNGNDFLLTIKAKRMEVMHNVKLAA